MENVITQIRHSEQCINLIFSKGNKNNKTYMYLDIYCVIAGTDLATYRAMLAVCEFARYVHCEHNRRCYKRRFTQCTVVGNATTWTLAGLKHREDDLPAIVRPTGHNEWYQHGKLHRDGDQPAVICASGDQYWCQHNKLHRDGDQPAVIRTNGDQRWYQNGHCYRNSTQ